MQDTVAYQASQEIMLLSCTWEGLFLNLSLVISYSDTRFCCFARSLQENAGRVPQLGNDHFLPDSSQFVTHCII